MLIHREAPMGEPPGSPMGASSMDSPICQTLPASPAEPGGLPLWASGHILVGIVDTDGHWAFPSPFFGPAHDLARPTGIFASNNDIICAICLLERDERAS